MLATVVVVLASTLRSNALFNIADLGHLFPRPRFVKLPDDCEYVGRVVPVPKMPSKVIVTTGKTGMHLMPLHETDRIITCIYWSSDTCFDEKVEVLKNVREWFQRNSPKHEVLNADLRDEGDYIAWMTATTPA